MLRFLAVAATQAADRALLSRAPAAEDYVSIFHVDQWNSHSEARVEVLNESTAVHFISFDTKGTTPATWFAPDRHTASSWTDLPTDAGYEVGNGRFFSIAGSPRRHFYINQRWDGCPNDEGWLMISTNATCDWEQGAGPAKILYSTMPTIAHVPNTTEMAVADSLIVFVR